MRVLVTGSEGFIGKETRRLLEKEKKVETKYGDGFVEKEHHVFRYDLMRLFDIRNYEQLKRVVGEYEPKRILHLAAIARFQDADKNPRLANQINVGGTENVVRVAEEFGVHLVFSSTGSVLMPLDGIEPPFDEGIRARGNSQYGCSKAIGEQIVKTHTPHIILRYAHIYGREKRHHGLIGAFADRIARGMQPRLYGGQQTNDFIYVKDVARANVLALEASWDCWDNIYNIGTGEELSAENAGELVIEALGKKGKVEMERIPPRTVDPGRFVLDVSKAERMLGFKAEYSFREGLADMMSGEGV